MHAALDSLVTYSFRKAAIEDTERLVELRVAMQVELGNSSELLADSLRTYFARTLADETFRAYVACRGDRIVASSGMVIDRHPPSGGTLDGRYAYIMNMYTVPEERGRGLATELLKRLLDDARQLQIASVVLHAMPKGRSIYLKAGFMPSNSEMRLRLH